MAGPPTAQEGHHDQMLTDFAVSNMEQPSDWFVYDKVFPVQPVNHRSDVFPVYPRGHFLQDQVAPRPVGGVPREVHFRTDQDTYVCIEEGLRAKTDRQQTANWNLPGPGLAQSKVRLLASQHKIHNERKWVSEYMVPGKWSTNKVGVAASPGDGEFLQLDQANRDLIDFFMGECDAFALLTGVWPNRIVIGRAIYRAFRRNSLIRDQIKHTSSAVATLAILATFFDVEQVLSPLGVYNSAGGEIIDPGTGRPVVQETYSRFVGERDMLLTYAGDNPGPDYVGGGTHFAWTGLMAEAFATPDQLADGQTAAVMRGAWEYGEWFDLLQAWTPKTVSPDLGVFYSNVVTA